MSRPESHPDTALTQRKASTAGTTVLLDAFEHISEKIIRHLASRANWTSRPSSPRSNDLGFDPLAGASPTQTNGQLPIQPDGLEQFFLDPFATWDFNNWDIMDAPQLA